MNYRKRKNPKHNDPRWSEADYDAEQYVLGGIIELSDPDSSTLIKVVNSLTVKLLPLVKRGKNCF